MYTLTLTNGEIRAFQWVGYRYGNGDKMLDEIVQGSPEFNYDEIPDIADYPISESSAWAIQKMAEEDDCLFPCFAPELQEKMLDFLAKIV